MDIYIVDDLDTNDAEAVLSARQGYLLGQRVSTLENSISSIATTGEIDAIFA